MTKLTTEEHLALNQGYEEGERVSRAGGKARYTNPYLWSSRMWEAFEFGYYAQEKGLTLGDKDYWQRRRANIFENPTAHQFKLHYGKSKNSFGITRQK